MGCAASYVPHAKSLGVTFDHEFTFKIHFEGILENVANKTLPKNVDQPKLGTKPTNNFQIYNQCVRPTFRIQSNFHNNCFG